MLRVAVGVVLCLFILGCASVETGEEVVVPPPPPVKFVASRNGDVFHELKCSYVGQITERNKVFFYSYEDATGISSGRVPCSRCKPVDDDAIARTD